MSNVMGTTSSEKIELMGALGSAQTVKETLKTFKEMESCFAKSELGPICFIVAQKLFDLGHKDIHQVISFAKRAITILTVENAPTLQIGLVNHWLGALCFDLSRLDECLLYLNLASDTLSNELKNEVDPINAYEVMSIFLDVEEKLCTVTKKLAMNEEVVVHAKRMLRIKKMTMEKGCLELGDAYKEVYMACLIAVDIEGGLPYCEKALEIYKKHYGDESFEVGKVTMHVGLVYMKTGQLEKAFEMNQIAVRVLKKVAPNSVDTVAAEADGANILIDLGRFKEAVTVMKRLVTYSDLTKQEKMNLLISLVKALFALEKFSDAKKYLKAVEKIFDKKGLHPKLIAIGCGDISMYYEKMKDYAAAISLLQRALSLPELPQTMIPAYSSNVFRLMCLSGREKEGVLYMEVFVEELKESYGPKHDVVGHVYAKWGAVCNESGRKVLAAKYLVKAKYILDDSYGPSDLTSLKLSHDLSVALAGLQRYNRALEVEENVAKGVKGLPPSELEFVHEVSEHLAKMRTIVAGYSTTASSQLNDGGLPAKMSKCDIADDGKGS